MQPSSSTDMMGRSVSYGSNSAPKAFCACWYHTETSCLHKIDTVNIGKQERAAALVPYKYRAAAVQLQHRCCKSAPVVRGELQLAELCKSSKGDATTSFDVLGLQESQVMLESSVRAIADNSDEKIKDARN